MFAQALRNVIRKAMNTINDEKEVKASLAN